MDLATKQAIPLVEPRRLVLSGGAPVRFQDYAPLPAERQIPKWHLAYFLTCTSVEIRPGLARFEGIMTSVAARRYPGIFQCLVALGVWGTAGDHTVKTVMEFPDRKVTVAEGVISLEYFPEPYDFVAEVRAEIGHRGPAFLTCYIDEQRVARRALFFAEVELEGRSPAEISPEWELQKREWTDADLDTRGGAEIVYFSLCQGCQDEGGLLTFEREYLAVYSREYPVIVKAHAVLGLRLPVGEHVIRLEVVSAASGAAHVATNTKLASSSSAIVSRLHGDIPLRFAEVGPHLVNVLVNGQRLTTAFLHADDPDSPTSYKLRTGDLPKPGETFVLLKRPTDASTKREAG
jgi:hypothetical protein